MHCAPAFPVRVVREPPLPIKMRQTEYRIIL